MQTSPCVSGVDLIERISSEHSAVTWRGSESCREQSPRGTGAPGARPKLEDTRSLPPRPPLQKGCAFHEVMTFISTGRSSKCDCRPRASCLPRDPHSAWERRLGSSRAVPRLCFFCWSRCVWHGRTGASAPRHSRASLMKQMVFLSLQRKEAWIKFFNLLQMHLL